MSIHALVRELKSCAMTPVVAPVVAQALSAVGVALEVYAWVAVPLTALILLVSLVLALILIWRRGNDQMAPVVAAFLLVSAWAFGAGGNASPPVKESALAMVFWRWSWTVPHTFRRLLPGRPLATPLRSTDSTGSGGRAAGAPSSPGGLHRSQQGGRGGGADAAWSPVILGPWPAGDVSQRSSGGAEGIQAGASDLRPTG
jgi:hypothetical protein